MTTRLYWAIFAIVGAAILFGLYRQDQDCRAKGGVLLRGPIWYTCAKVQPVR